MKCFWISVKKILTGVIITFIYLTTFITQTLVTNDAFLKDKFFSIIAHDLKNPMGTLLGFSELLHKEFIGKNGGTKWVESEKNKGSRFYFTVKAVV